MTRQLPTGLPKHVADMAVSIHDAFCAQGCPGHTPEQARIYESAALAALDVLAPDSVSPVKEWADIAYEMWAMLCNSTTDGHSSIENWTAARNRLRDRFHAALDTLPKETQP